MGIRTESQQLQHRRTKIVATVGPASSAPTMLEALIKAGVDVFRLNFSHGSHDEHASVAVAIRNAAVRLGVSVAILADLCGPKIRTGRFEGGAVTLEKGRTVVLTVRDVVGNAQLIPSTYAGLADDLRAGSVVLLDDGQLRLLVERVDGTEVVCRVIEGGVLRDRKGINLPNVSISAPSLTPKDREDALFALELGVDLLALSFVRRPDDVDALRDLVASSSPTPWLVSKIEKPEALERIDGILDRSDAIMVARGDLGVELPPEFVPIAQGQLVDLARARGKPVIVATQMLESTVERTRPTRAEVTDVSSAVSSGADAVMLSAETAIGKHPIGSVEMMDRIARTTEGYLWSRGGFGAVAGEAAPWSQDLALEVHEAVSRATGQLSRDLLVRAIVVFSRSGRSAQMVAAGRPQAPVLGVTPDETTCRRMKLLWGVVPVRAPLGDGIDPLYELARRVARESGLAKEGDRILKVGGFRPDPKSNAPTVSVLTV